MSRLSSLVILVALLSIRPASACINDSQTVRTERDFKKHYELKSGQPQGKPSDSPNTEDGGMPLIATVVGLGLLASSVALNRSSMRRG